MRIATLTTAALLSAATAFAQTPVPSTAQSEREVLAVVDRLFDALTRRDTVALRGLFAAPPAQLVSSSVRQGQPVMETETVDGWLRGFAGIPDSLRLVERTFDRVVHVDDNLASVWTKYTFHVNDRFSHCGVDNFVLARTGGEWKIIFLADTRRRQPCQMEPSR